MRAPEADEARAAPPALELPGVQRPHQHVRLQPTHVVVVVAVVQDGADGVVVTGGAYGAAGSGVTVLAHHPDAAGLVHAVLSAVPGDRCNTAACLTTTTATGP
jgi:hypothetical protein